MITEQLQKLIKKVQELKVENISCQLNYNSGSGNIQVLIFNHPWKAWGKPDLKLEAKFGRDEDEIKKLILDLNNYRPV